MKKSLIISLMFMLLVYFLPADIFAQPRPDTGAGATEGKNGIDKIRAIQSKFGTGKIILKDRGSIRGVIIHEINNYWIVYDKEGNLHDLMIEKIERIEIGREKQRVIFFDKNNKPKIY